MIRSIKDIDEYLRVYYSNSSLPRIGTNYRLENTLELSEAVGSPHERLKVVHVAGTSGKTSTSYFMAALLREAGLKVGLTVSPHISSIAERAQINGKVLNEMKYVEYFREYIGLIDGKLERRPSFFELMMVFALWVFDREKVDYAVVETGMGGLYDSSNICRREDKVCVITDIGLDHVNALGNTLEKIAEQKAGIIATGNIVCAHRQSRAVMSRFEKAVAKEGARLEILTPSDYDTFFDRNFALAKFTYNQLEARDEIPTLDEGQLLRARATHIPGRLEKIRVGKMIFVLDGAHNAQKLETMFSSLDKTYGDRKWPIILALKHDKDIRSVVPIISDHAKYIVASEFEKTQDMPVSAMAANELAGLFGNSARAIVPLDRAVESLFDKNEKEVLVTGSLYVVAEARAWLLSEKNGIVEE